MGICVHLDDWDQITSTHRGHGHFLAKGGDQKAMFAEIYGMRTDVCGGMGGSMHVADFARGIVGTNGVVSTGLSIATGVAFASKLDGSGRVAVCFFGDGAANQGVLMECLNIGSLSGNFRCCSCAKTTDIRNLRPVTRRRWGESQTG